MTMSEPAAATVPKAPDNEFYEIRAIPNKGYGCIALKDIPRGTRILADAPLLVVPEAEYLQSDLEAPFAKLTQEEKEAYFSLASCHGQDPKIWPSRIHECVVGREVQRVKEQHNARVGKEKSLISVFQTNCMEWDAGAAVFPNAARFNHSCNPNANFTWNGSIGKETIHVINNVKEGEEITFSYCDQTHDKSLRARELKHYGFVCVCPACDGDGDEDEDDPESFAHKSADRRYRIAELLLATKLLRGPRLAKAVGNPTWVSQMLELAGLYEDEGEYSVRLAAVHLDLAVVCEATRDLKSALVCAGRAVKIQRDCQGVDSPDYVRVMGTFERIRGGYKASLSSSEA